VPSTARLILASASPRRRELLAQLGVPFEVVVAEVTEHEEATTDPRILVAHNAALKADWVARLHPDAVVLGADTTVFLDGASINKPRDLEDARAMLRRLSGREHTVYTGIALRQVSHGVRKNDLVASQVRFKPFGDAVIEAYLGLAHTLDKAGAYSIQDHTDMIVQGYRGSYSNIMGLPLEATKQILTGSVLQG
jgi:septum formation protein